ncbi:DUF4160 domain-containing protein [uncultured Duncaniella sp.]|uniref:DUF4160 domain-containing protein n=1 Tax=uncultured Duncaniella sp. TaxID=2768039 RepID=UPI0025E1613D|nr:DUF4160 domain-containing protein [uncultured Duncaniella sp.]
MPELFRFFGFSFFFFSKEHEPIHVHVEGAEGKVIFDYDEDKDCFIIRELINIKPNDLKRIRKIIKENQDIIIKRWKEYFE